MVKSLRNEESKAPVGANRPSKIPTDGARAPAIQVEMPSRPDNAPASSRPLGTPPIYDTIAHLGRGKIADVSLALARGDAGFRKVVAIKRFRPDVHDTGGLKRFLTEARLAARFDHPNIVRTHEVVQTGGTWLMVMEFLDGQPLSRIIKRAGLEGGIPFGIHLKMLADALAGLHAVHELCDESGTPLEIVHRDVTSHNVFVCYRGETKLIDFGAATDKFARSRMTSSIDRKDFAWTPFIAKAEPLDRQADLFAMGTMLWEAAAGPSTEIGDDEETTIFKRGTVDLAARGLGNAARKGLLRICERALSSDPTVRFSSAAEMQWEIEGVLRELGAPITSSEVQEYVCTLFADERARLKHLLTVQSSKGGKISALDEMLLESPKSGLRRPQLTPAPASRLPSLHEAPFSITYDSLAPTMTERPLQSRSEVAKGAVAARVRRRDLGLAALASPKQIGVVLAALGALAVLFVVRVLPTRRASMRADAAVVPAAIARFPSSSRVAVTPSAAAPAPLVAPSAVASVVPTASVVAATSAAQAPAAVATGAAQAPATGLAPVGVTAAPTVASGVAVPTSLLPARAPAPGVKKPDASRRPGKVQIKEDLFGI